MTIPLQTQNVSYSGSFPAGPAELFVNLTFKVNKLTQRGARSSIEMTAKCPSLTHLRPRFPHNQLFGFVLCRLKLFHKN